MTSYNSCPNLTHALRDTSLTNVYSTPFEDSRCTTPQQPNNSSHDLNDTVHGVDSTPTTLSARSVVADQTAVTDSSQTMNRSLSEGRALEKPVPAVLPTGSAGNPTVSPFAMKPFTSTHSPTKKSHTGSNTADANIALRQSAFSRSASEYSIASAAGATPHHDSLVSSQSSISPASGLDRSASSTSLASSFSSCMAGDEASRSSPPTSDHVPSPASSQTPAVVSLIRQNSGSVNSTGRTTRSRTSASFSMGKPRRSGKLTE